MEQSFQKLLDKFELILSGQGSLDQILLSTAELLKSGVAHYDWVGFYILPEGSGTLVLGPYCGKPTDHTHIPVGRGVCGQVAASGQTMVVQDVTRMENYLSCSMDVQSEIVVPILRDGVFLAEIDIDSHAYAPFTGEDEQFLQTIAAKLAGLF